jgi:hypothetical protein
VLPPLSDWRRDDRLAGKLPTSVSAAQQDHRAFALDRQFLIAAVQFRKAEVKQFLGVVVGDASSCRAAPDFT